jgi:hypothetical protein
MGSFNIKANGAWHPAKQVHVKANGQWRKAREVWLKASGQWRRVMIALKVEISPTAGHGFARAPSEEGWGQAQCTFTASVTDGTAPFIYAWTHSGEGQPSGIAGYENQSSVTIRMTGPGGPGATGQVVCTVTDATGTVVASEPATFSLSISPYDGLELPGG